MTSRLLKTVLAVLAILLVATAAFLGRGVPWDAQSDVYSALFQVSAIVFGVMGAWIAIVHPKGLREILGKQGQPSNKTLRTKKLLNAMKCATGIVAACLIVQLLAPLSKEVEWLRQNKEIVRSGSMAFVATLVVIQLWTLVLSLLPIDEVEAELDVVSQSAADRKKRMSGTSRGKISEQESGDNLL